MRREILFSIIVPVKVLNNYIRELIPHIQALNSNHWELIIIPNEYERDEWNDPRINFLPSGSVSPARKRDLGALKAKGRWLYFLDDDSYPESNVLEVATKHIADSEVVGLGGPAITPPSNTFWQKVSGAVFVSSFSGGNPHRYRSLGGVRQVDDWPSVNLMVKKDAFLLIGGFDNDFWPGEDTKLCLDLLKSGKKIFYIPNMIVWHHRREGLISHLHQVGAYGFHRGFFARKFPENSRKLKYFTPSIFLILLLFFLLNFCINQRLESWMICILFIYTGALALAFRDIYRIEGVRVGLAALVYIFTTHIYYGFRFIQGFIAKDIKSKLR